MDDIFFAYLGDPDHRESKKARGQDSDWLIDRYAWMMHKGDHGSSRRHVPASRTTFGRPAER